jgi:hypothetical protein
MTVQDTRTAIPRPRSSAHDATAGSTPEPPVGEFPWPEPWHYSRGARPRSEFWDVATASWHSRGPVVPPRREA